MLIVTKWDNLHEVSGPIFLENKKKLSSICHLLNLHIAWLVLNRGPRNKLENENISLCALSKDTDVQSDQFSLSSCTSHDFCQSTYAQANLHIRWDQLVIRDQPL